MNAWIGARSLRFRVVLGAVYFFVIMTPVNVFFEDGGWISSSLASLTVCTIGGFVTYSYLSWTDESSAGDDTDGKQA